MHSESQLITIQFQRQHRSPACPLAAQAQPVPSRTPGVLWHLGFPSPHRASPSPSLLPSSTSFILSIYTYLIGLETQRRLSITSPLTGPLLNFLATESTYNRSQVDRALNATYNKQALEQLHPASISPSEL
ncbi:hypothetical protein CVT25_003130 [Psilocybe cyanescens]|uniref:Uncharacterized protein n=1 Tax=Psilocybe cyanescens TaxID=93625 RepID=A0A409XQU7_PSICY|nr:hypothetical protein CVT25_003130 [Psilocybe cyanescens]